MHGKISQISQESNGDWIWLPEPDVWTFEATAFHFLKRTAQYLKYFKGKFLTDCLICKSPNKAVTVDCLKLKTSLSNGKTWQSCKIEQFLSCFSEMRQQAKMCMII